MASDSPMRSRSRLVIPPWRDRRVRRLSSMGSVTMLVRSVRVFLALLVLSATSLSLMAQTTEPEKAVDDFKPSALNQANKNYPQVNSEGRVRARLAAPNASTVMLDIGAVRYPLT